MNRTLACAVGADQHIVLAQTQVGPVNSAEAAYRESEQLHRESVSAESSVVFQNIRRDLRCRIRPGPERAGPAAVGFDDLVDLAPSRKRPDVLRPA